MTYTLETSRHAGAYRAGRQGSAIDTIVIHHWGDPAGNPTFDGTASFFVRGGSNTSAHYVVEAGRVARMVADTDTAYHAGNWGMNLRSIGIECNPRASDADKATVAELIRDLWAAHGPLRIIGHQDVISTDCPGRYYPPATVLAPWLTGTAPATHTATHTATTLEDDMPIFMRTTDTSVWLLKPGAPPRGLNGQEWALWARLGAPLLGGDFNRAEVDIVNSLLQPTAQPALDSAVLAAAVAKAVAALPTGTATVDPAAIAAQVVAAVAKMRLVA